MELGSRVNKKDKTILRWVRTVVLRVIKEKRLYHLDQDSLIASGLLGYSQALTRYDASRGASVKTYAEYRIKGAVLDEARKVIGDERNKYKRPKQVYNYDFSRVSDFSHQMNLMDSGIDIDNFFKSIPLGFREKEILKCRMGGSNLREIGARFNICESRASQIISEVKRAILPWFEEFLGAKFEVVEYSCHKCEHINLLSSLLNEFECEMCGDKNKTLHGVRVNEKEFN